VLIESHTTRERILRAAECLFGQHGFSDSSLRQITDEAGVNLASVNYHFGSKEELYRQVLLRCVRPLNEERLTLLTEAEQLAGDQPVPLRAIVDTLIRPPLRHAADRSSGGIALVRLISRDLADPQSFMLGEMAKEFDPLIARYTHALTQALPGVPLAELAWRMQFLIGALLYMAAHQHDLEKITHGLCSGDDVDGCIRRLIDFCAAGLCVPKSEI
jgi:AcrR family transcriptional regulator